MVYIKFEIVFKLFVYKIHGDCDWDGAFLCGTEILNSRLNEMDLRYNAFVFEITILSKYIRSIRLTNCIYNIDTSSITLIAFLSMIE